MTGALAGLAVMWSLPGAILSGAAAAAGFALMATVGNLGGYLAPFALGWVKQVTGQLEYGLYAMAAGMVIGALLMALLPRLHSIAASPAQPAAAATAA